MSRQDENVQTFSLRDLPVMPDSADLWQAAEWLTSTDPALREQGFTLLTQHETARFSPLVCYLLVSLIDDPDLNLRSSCLHVLAGVFARRNNQHIAPAATRQYVAALLRRFGVEQVVRMLEVLGTGEPDGTRAHPEALARLLDRTPDINEHLTHIAADRRRESSIRLASVRMIGELGLLAALPALKGIQTRVAGHRAGQLSMRFAPLADPAADDLLQTLEETIRLLEEDT